MKKTLIFFLFFSFNLFAEQEIKKFSEWDIYISKDDFTDKKKYVVQSSCTSAYCPPNLDKLTLYFVEPYTYLWGLEHRAVNNCKSKNKDTIPVLFSVDNNEAVTIQMKPLVDSRADLIMDPIEMSNLEVLLLPLQMFGGEKIKIRINDIKECMIQTDLVFSLDGFMQAYEPVSKAMNKMFEKEIN